MLIDFKPENAIRGRFFKNLIAFLNSTPESSSKYLLGDNFIPSFHPTYDLYASIYTLMEGLLERSAFAYAVEGTGSSNTAPQTLEELATRDWRGFYGSAFSYPYIANASNRNSAIAYRDMFFARLADSIRALNSFISKTQYSNDYVYPPCAVIDTYSTDEESGYKTLPWSSTIDLSKNRHPAFCSKYLGLSDRLANDIKTEFTLYFNMSESDITSPTATNESKLFTEGGLVRTVSDKWDGQYISQVLGANATSLPVTRRANFDLFYSIQAILGNIGRIYSRCSIVKEFDYLETKKIYNYIIGEQGEVVEESSPTESSTELSDVAVFDYRYAYGFTRSLSQQVSDVGNSNNISMYQSIGTYTCEPLWVDNDTIPQGFVSGGNGLPNGYIYKVVSINVNGWGYRPRLTKSGNTFSSWSATHQVYDLDGVLSTNRTENEGLVINGNRKYKRLKTTSIMTKPKNQGTIYDSYYDPHPCNLAFDNGYVNRLTCLTAERLDDTAYLYKGSGKSIVAQRTPLGQNLFRTKEVGIDNPTKTSRTNLAEMALDYSEIDSVVSACVQPEFISPNVTSSTPSFVGGITVDKIYIRYSFDSIDEGGRRLYQPVSYFYILINGVAYSCYMSYIIRRVNLEGGAYGYKAQRMTISGTIKTTVPTSMVNYDGIQVSAPPSYSEMFRHIKRGCAIGSDWNWKSLPATKA